MLHFTLKLSLGFVWDMLAYDWEEGFRHLEVYASENGHCRVPKLHNSEDGYSLGQWAGVQRRRRDRMPAEQTARLDALGFVWHMLAYDWEEGFKHLEVYARENGHCEVPGAYKTEDGYRLGQWVTVQRRRTATMSPEQKERLDTHGFVWSTK